MFRRSERKNALVFVHRDHSVREYVEEMKNLHLNAVTFHQQVMSGNTGEIINFLHDFRTGILKNLNTPYFLNIFLLTLFFAYYFTMSMAKEERKDPFQNYVISIEIHLETTLASR